MQAFSKCISYEDYLKVISNTMINGIKYNETNESSYASLALIKDKDTQDKMIKIMNHIDRTLSFNGSRGDEMWKKIDYFLALGVYYFLLKEKFNNLSENAIYTLIMGDCSSITPKNKEMILLLSDEELLDSIYKQNESKNSTLFDYINIFFMIHEHFDKNPFDLNNKDLCDKFIKEMTKKINEKTLNNDVMNMIEYWESNEEIRKTVLGGGISK